MLFLETSARKGKNCQKAIEMIMQDVYLESRTTKAYDSKSDQVASSLSQKTIVLEQDSVSESGTDSGDSSTGCAC